MNFVHALLTSSASSEHPTPAWLVDQLAREFGPFDLDPAATAANAKAPRFHTEVEGGLSQPWGGGYGSTRPTGREIGLWLRRAAQAGADGHRVVALVPARTSSAWWHEATRSASLVRLLPGRLTNPDGSQWPFGCAILVFGGLPGKRLNKCDICDKFFRARARAGAKTCSPRCRKALSRKTSLADADKLLRSLS